MQVGGEAGDSFEQWHQVTCRNYSISEFRRESEQPFAARIVMRPFGALGLSEVSASVGDARLIRGAADIRRDQRDHFMLFYVIEGSITVSQDGRDAPAAAGDLFLYDQTRPLALDFAMHYRAWMVSIPRPLLDARVRRTCGFAAHRLARTSPLGALAGTMVGQLDGFGAETAPDIIDRIGTATLDVVATALDYGAGLPDEPVQHRLRARAEAFMRSNLDMPELDIETIAGALHISPRTLNRAFACNGTTPMRWLWRQRLEACKRALTNERTRSVTDVALSVGFNDVSHFSRAFKQAFGVSPGSLRRR